MSRPLPSWLPALPLMLLAAHSGGCQVGQQVSPQRLFQHQAMVDLSGLKPPEVSPAVRVRAAVPQTWKAMELEKHPLFSHQQWKSRSERTAIGIVYARMPLPLSAGSVLWLATRQYKSQRGDGKTLRQWDDLIGRKWFEAENDQYHAVGYVIVNGRDAWIAYCGFRITVPPEPTDVSLAGQSLESIVPLFDGLSTGAPATQPSHATTNPSTTVSAID